MNYKKYNLKSLLECIENTNLKLVIPKTWKIVSFKNYNTKLFIDSAHYIKGYKGNCKNIHGHTWLVEVWFKGDSTHKNRLGILVDFNITKLIKDRLDHQFLNHIF